jgi:hypothetical protein
VDGRLFPEGIEHPVFMTIKNILGDKTSLLVTETEKALVI